MSKPVGDTEDASIEAEDQEEETSELEKMETSFEDFDDDEQEDDADEESEESESSEGSEESEEDESANESTEETEEEAEGDEGTQSQDEESEGGDAPSEEDVKKHNAEMAQKRIEERNQREAEKRKQAEEYLAGAEDERDLAVRQLQVDAYNNRVVANENNLTNGIQQAVATIDIFHTGSKEEKEELMLALEDFEQLYIKRDRNGDPVEVKGDVHDFLQKKAESIKRLTQVGARKQAKAKTKAKTRTDVIPSRTPKTPKVDADLEAFDDEAGRY